MEFTQTLLDEARQAAEMEDNGVGSSEPTPATEVTPVEPAAPADPAANDDGANGGEPTDDNGVPPTGNEPKGTEPEGKQAGKKDDTRNNANDGGERRKPLSRLEKAEFSAAKYKRKAKEITAQRDAAVEELNRYKDLNPSMFQNEEEKADFLAWRAAKRQQVNDYEETLNNMYEEHERDVYEEKISNCYNEEGVKEYTQLDEHYGEPFAVLCQNVDPDNVILDFLRNSALEPALRHVIYQDGELQERLLGTQYRNPHIAAAERLNVLKNLERQVRDYYANAGRQAQQPQQQQQQRPVVVPKAPVAQQQGRTNNNPNGNVAVPPQQPNVSRPRFTLPPRQQQPVAPAVPNNVVPMQQPVQQHQQPYAQPPVQRKAPQVTGALTRGNVGSGSVDPSVGADALFAKLFQNN